MSNKKMGQIFVAFSEYPSFNYHNRDGRVDGSENGNFPLGYLVKMSLLWTIG